MMRANARIPLRAFARKSASQPVLGTRAFAEAVGRWRTLPGVQRLAAPFENRGSPLVPPIIQARVARRCNAPSPLTPSALKRDAFTCEGGRICPLRATSAHVTHIASRILNSLRHPQRTSSRFRSQSYEEPSLGYRGHHVPQVASRLFEVVSLEEHNEFNFETT